MNVHKQEHNTRYQVLDLFSGCGGFTQGFKHPSYEVVAGIDIWDTAIETKLITTIWRCVKI